MGSEEEIYYFDDYSAVEHWKTDWANISDGDEDTYGKTALTTHPVHLLDSNTCPGDNLGTITTVELRVKGYYSFMFPSSIPVALRPVFAGGDGDDHEYILPRNTGAWSDWFDITEDTNAPATWDWDKISDLDCDLESTSGLTPFASKVEIRVTYEEVAAVAKKKRIVRKLGLPNPHNIGIGM